MTGKQRVIGVVLVVVAIGAWLALRGGPAAPTGGAAPGAAARDGGELAPVAAPGGVEAAGGAADASAPGGAPTPADDAGAAAAPLDAAAAGDATGPGPDAAPPRDAPDGPMGAADRGVLTDGGLVDRTGRNDGLGAQLNREFMPLAGECLDLATARNPALAGVFIVQVSLAPGEHGKAIVAAVKLRPDSTVTDPELLECIRESSFSLDALVSPYDFDLSMPITRAAP